MNVGEVNRLYKQIEKWYAKSSNLCNTLLELARSELQHGHVLWLNLICSNPKMCLLLQSGPLYGSIVSWYMYSSAHLQFLPT